MKVEDILDNYVIAALWSSHDDAGNPLDDDRDAGDIAPETLDAMREDVSNFLDHISERAEEYVSRHHDNATAATQLGHDFWLTRNGHGAGFWDRGLGELGDWLTDAAKGFGGVDLYVGDDGKVYA